MDSAYAAIGRAIFAAQAFELTFAVSFQAFRMISEESYMEKTAGFIPENAFKDPSSKWVRYLKDKGDIAADLEERISIYLEARHILVHRWIQRNGWPEDRDVAEMKRVQLHAEHVTQEATALTKIIADYIVKYAEPEWADKNLADYSSAMKKIFHLSHV